MVLKIGPPSGPQVVATISDGNAAWGMHEGAYSIPPGQTVTRFQFEATATASGNLSIGDFLDAVDFTPCPDTDDDGTPDYADTDSDADTLLDSTEGTGDNDGDGTPNWRDPDPPAPRPLPARPPAQVRRRVRARPRHRRRPPPRSRAQHRGGLVPRAHARPAQIPSTGNSRATGMGLLAVVVVALGAIVIVAARRVTPR